MEKYKLIQKLTGILSNLECYAENHFDDKKDFKSDDKKWSVENYYINDERLYVSNTCGKDCVIGSVYDLENISFYRYDEDNNKLDILFEFPIYKVAVSHKYFMAVELSVYQNDGWVFEKARQDQWNRIGHWIEAVLKENYFVTEKEQLKLLDRLYHLTVLEAEQLDEEEWADILNEVRKNTKYISIQRQFCITCLLLNRLEDLKGVISIENYTIMDMYKIITEMYEKYDESLGEEICEEYGAKMLDFFMENQEGK